MAGKRLAAWIEADIIKKIKIIAVERNTTVQNIVTEAIEMWFKDNLSQK